MKPTQPHILPANGLNGIRCWCCPDVVHTEHDVMVGMALDHDGEPVYITDSVERLYVIHYKPLTVKRGHGRRGSVMDAREMSATA